METYPGELLVGVFPLVFCVDATLSKATEEAEGDSGRHSDSSSPPHARSQFDRFLDAMAASLMNDMEDHPLQIGDDPMTTPSKPDGMMSLFRSEDEDDDSEAEDEALLSPLPNNFTSPGISASYDGMIDGGGDLRKSVTSAGRSRSFNLPRFSVSRTGSRSSNNNNASEQSQHLLNTSYAKALQQGQGFFQRARIVSISTRHGFPPSKDPNGTSNRVNEFMEGTLNNKPSPSRLKPNHFLAAIQKRPIDGILPSGWMEKHAHALPSVLLVVVQVTHDQQQFQQNELLLRTLDNLQISLASKRQCTIQIVGLVQEGVSQVLAEQWTQTIADKLKGQELTLISTKDLQQDAAPSLGLKHLHKTVRDASLNYYLHQTRRTKHKLFKLGPTRGSPLSLPLSIRYCFKIAMLYEFQWKQEKSLKFLVEAYRHVETYYRYLLQQRNLEDGEDAAGGCGEAISDNDNNKKKEDPVKISVSNHSSSETANTAGTDGTGEGVELALQSPASANHNNKTDDMDLLLLKSHAPPEDMVHQCRAVADWLNFKILQSGFVSHTEGGLLAASTQWQKHSQAFCSPRRSFVCSPDHAWLDWSYVAHQRVVVSQLLERHPPNALGGLGNLFDEVILRCSPWRTYQSAAEALLKLGSEVQKSAGKIAEGSDGVDKMRTRYVGGLDNTGYTPKLQEETKVNHRGECRYCSYCPIQRKNFYNLSYNMFSLDARCR